MAKKYFTSNSESNSESESEDFDMVFSESKCEAKFEAKEENTTSTENKLEPFSKLIQRKKRELAAEHPWESILQKASYIPKMQLVKQDLQLVDNCQFDYPSRSLIFPLEKGKSSPLFIPEKIITQIETQIFEWQQERQLCVCFLGYSLVQSKKDRTRYSEMIQNYITQFEENRNKEYDFLVVEVSLNLSRDWNFYKFVDIKRDYSSNLEIV